MKDYLGIQSVHALEVLDSRGNPTVQVEVVTEGGFSGLAIVPSGASTGSFEAVELRDQDENRYSGKGVLDAVENVNSKIAKKMIGMNVYDQRKIDNFLIDLDKTPNKANLGANAILGVSLACCRAASNSLGTPLYSYIGGVNAHVLPTPMMNILNGGKHSDNNLSIQEFMIVPSGGKTFAEKLEMGVTVYHNLKKLLKSKNLSTAVRGFGFAVGELRQWNSYFLDSWASINNHTASAEPVQFGNSSNPSQSSSASPSSIETIG